MVAAEVLVPAESLRARWNNDASIEQNVSDLVRLYRVSSLVLLSGGARVTWADGRVGQAVGRFATRVLRVLRGSPRLLGETVRRSVQSPELYTWARRLGRPVARQVGPAPVLPLH